MDVDACPQSLRTTLCPLGLVDVLGFESANTWTQGQCRLTREMVSHHLLEPDNGRAHPLNVHLDHIGRLAQRWTEPVKGAIQVEVEGDGVGGLVVEGADILAAAWFREETRVPVTLLGDIATIERVFIPQVRQSAQRQLSARRTLLRRQARIDTERPANGQHALAAHALLGTP